MVGDVVADLRTFFAQVTAGKAPGADEDYFALGLVNSLLALELVSYVEHRYGIAVEVEDLDLDNFRTMNRIAAFVRKKLSTMAR
jgi:methoxymalonate biosynthesis acyl carrier protein